MINKKERGLEMHRTASAVISLHAGKNIKMEIIHLMSVFKNISPKARDEVKEAVRKRGRNLHKYMTENLGSLCCRSNHRLLTFILKDEAPLESSW